MYSNVMKTMSKPIMVTIVAVLVLLGLSALSPSGPMKWAPLGSHPVYADGKDDGGALFTPLMKDLEGVNYNGKGDNPGGNGGNGGSEAGAYWAKVNGVSNGFLGMSTGTSASFNFSDPSASGEDKKQQRATATATGYMRALSSVGLDHSYSGGAVSNIMTIMGRGIGGLLLLIPLIIVQGANFLFNTVLWFADALNIYKYLDGDQVPSGLVAPVYIAIRDLYHVFQDLGLIITVIILGFMLWIYSVGLHQLNNGARLGGIAGKMFLRIFVFVAGPIVISMAFSSAVTSLKGAYGENTDMGSLVGSYIVNFEGWSEHSRLALPASMDHTLKAWGKSKDVTPQQVMDINKDGAGMTFDGANGAKVGADQAFEMIAGWATSSGYDAGQYMSTFQQHAADKYFEKDSNHKKIGKLMDKDSAAKTLVENGSLEMQGNNYKSYYTSSQGGSNPRQNQNANDYDAYKGFGLSTVGMYNYLSSSVEGNSMQWTNVGSLANNVSKPGHYSYGMVGRGMQFLANYMTLFVDLCAIAYVAFKFSMRALSAVIKGFFSTLIRFFTTGMSGSPVQLSKLLADFLSMLVQLFGGAFLYSLITKFIVDLSTNASSIVNNQAAASHILSAGAGEIVSQMAVSIMIATATFFLVKYSGVFNKGVDEFLTQGIDRLMGKAGYDSQTARRNDQGLTAGTGGGVGQDGHAGTGGGINNDGLDSNRSRLTNPDTFLGRRANRKADEADVMNAADDQSKAGRGKALAAYKAGKAMRNQLRDAGFGGIANDLDNLAALKRRDGDKEKSDLQSKDAQNQEADKLKDGEQSEGNSPVLGGTGVEGVGDGSMDDLVDAQAVSDADKDADTIPPLEYDANGKPTRESVAKQIAAANHAVSDVPTKRENKMDKNARNAILKRAGMSSAKSAEEANARVQSANDDVRTAQMALAQAKSPEEIENASKNLKSALMAASAVQDDAADFATREHSAFDPSSKIADTGRVANKLIELDDARDAANENLVQVDKSFEVMEDNAVAGEKGAAFKKQVSRQEARTARYKAAAKEAKLPTTTAPKSVIRAQAQFENVRQDMVRAGLKSVGSDSQLVKKLDLANKNVQNMETAFRRNPSKVNYKKVQQAQEARSAVEEKLITRVGNSDKQRNYAEARVNLDNFVNGAIADNGGKDFNLKSPLATSQIREYQIKDEAVRSIDGGTKVQELQAKQAKAYAQKGKITTRISEVQQNAVQSGVALSAVGAGGVIADKEVIQKMAVERNRVVREANTGTIGATKLVASQLSGKSPQQALRTFNDMSATQKVMINRAASAGIVQVEETVVKSAQKAMSEKALSQTYMSQPLKTVVKQSRQISELVEEFNKVENGPGTAQEKNALLRPLREKRSVLKRQIINQFSDKNEGLAHYQKLVDGKTRAQVERKYSEVVQNVKNGHNVNVSGNFNNTNSVLTAAERVAPSVEEHRGDYTVENNIITDSKQARKMRERKSRFGK